jgi:hypothetical protein
MVDESNLRIRAKEYVQAAIDFLGSRVPKGLPETIPGFRQWVRSDNVFNQREVEIPYWSPMSRGVRPLIQLVHALSEYKLYVQVLKENALTAQYIGVVATGLGGRGVTVDELADRLLWGLVESRKGFEFSTAEFDTLWINFIADLERESLSFLAVAPLPGFTVDVGSISLGPNFEIAKLKDTELTQCLGVSIYPGVDVAGTVFVSNNGLRQRFSEAKLFRSATAQESQAVSNASHTRTERFLQVLHALRLFKRGTISIPGIATFPEHWPWIGGVYGMHLEHGNIRNNSYHLADDEREHFIKLWGALNRPRIKPFLDTAIRRFGYAGERHRPEDRLVDLMISAESLFLSDTAEAKDRGELRFRLALRAAFFTELDGFERKELFQFARNAYDARSAVVHGGLPENDVLKLPKKGKVTFREFVDFAEDFLRASLKKAVKTQPFKDRSLVDWDSLILS